MSKMYIHLSFLLCLLATVISGQDITTEASTSSDVTTAGDVIIAETTLNSVTEDATKMADTVESTSVSTGGMSDPKTSVRSGSSNPDPNPNNVAGDRLPRPNNNAGRYPISPYYPGYPFVPPYYFKTPSRPDWDDYPFQTVNGDGIPPRQWTNGNEPTGGRPIPSGADGGRPIPSAGDGSRMPPPWANGNEGAGNMPRPAIGDRPFNAGDSDNDDLPPPPQPGVTYKKVCYYYPVPDTGSYRPYDRPPYPNRRYGASGKYN